MRVAIVSILLAGGMLALGACSTPADRPILTLAERTEQCRRTGMIATGRQTGDARQDYRCGPGGRSVYDYGDRNITR